MAGADEPGGSGIATCDVFVSTDGGPFTPFLLGTAETSATFTGQFGHTYGFYSVASDHVGHREAAPSGADTTTTLAATLLQGDVDGDGQLTMADALLTLRHFLGLNQPALTLEQVARADMNGDGRVTPRDALRIFQAFLGLPAALNTTQLAPAALSTSAAPGGQESVATEPVSASRTTLLLTPVTESASGSIAWTQASQTPSETVVLLDHMQATMTPTLLASSIAACYRCPARACSHG